MERQLCNPRMIEKRHVTAEALSLVQGLQEFQNLKYRLTNITIYLYSK
jgi:hypothetical protein